MRRVFRVPNSLKKGKSDILSASEYPIPKIIRTFDIETVSLPIVYNKYGDHDPEGLLFVPFAQAKDIRCGRKPPVPLILRVNAGDWIEVTLHNLFDPHVPIRYNEYLSVPVDMPHVPSNRVSLHPQFLRYDPVRSSGLNVGRNGEEHTA